MIKNKVLGKLWDYFITNLWYHLSYRNPDILDRTHYILLFQVPLRVDEMIPAHSTVYLMNPTNLKFSALKLVGWWSHIEKLRTFLPSKLKL